MQKKCKKMQAWKQRPAKTQKKKKRKTKMQKFAVIAEIIKKTEKLAVSWSICMFCIFFCIFRCFCIFFCIFVALFLRFGRPLFPGLLFFLHFGRPRLPGLRFFFAFWSSLGFRCAFVSHFAGPRPLQPKRMQKQCKATFKHASKHKTCKAKFKQASKHEKNKQQMQKMQHTKMQTEDAKKAKCIVRIGVDNVLGWTRRSPLRFF